MCALIYRLKLSSEIVDPLADIGSYIDYRFMDGKKSRKLQRNKQGELPVENQAKEERVAEVSIRSYTYI